MTDSGEARRDPLPDLRLLTSREASPDNTATRIALRRSPRAHKPRTPPSGLLSVSDNQTHDVQASKRRGGRKKNRRRHKSGQDAPNNSESADAGTVVPQSGQETNVESTSTKSKSQKRPRRSMKRGKLEDPYASAQLRSDDELKGGETEAMSPGSGSPSAAVDFSVHAGAAGILPGSDTKPKRKRRRTPYSKLSWQEQMEILDQEAERARRQDDREEERLRRIRPEQLAEVRPKAPRNTTQFLIDSHASENEESIKDGDEIEIDEHGTMTEHSGQLLAIREELRKRQRDGLSETHASLNTAAE